MSPADTIRLALTHGGENVAWQCLELALDAAREAGLKAIRDNTRLSPADQLALALQAADEAIEELAVELSEVDEPAAE
jgi:hypothetical protein